MLLAFAAGAAALGSSDCLEGMAEDIFSDEMQAWIQDTSTNATILGVSKWTLKQQDSATLEKFQGMMRDSRKASLEENGIMDYTWTRDLFDEYSFWCTEKWASHADFVFHTSPEGAFGKVWGDFAAMTDSKVALVSYDELFSGSASLDAGSAPQVAQHKIHSERRREDLQDSCPATMNIDFNDPRLEEYSTNGKDMKMTINVFTKWTIKDQSAAGKEAWETIMKNAEKLSRAEPGCVEYMFGKDPLDEWSFWLFETWATKKEQLAHITTGAFGQQHEMWFAHADGLLATYFGGLSF